MPFYLHFSIQRYFAVEIYLQLTALSIYNHNECVILFNFMENIWSSDSLQTMRGISFFHHRNT